MARQENTPDTAPTETTTAGAFDIRSIIGGLLGVYGVILTVTGLWFTSAEDTAKADGANLNLWVGPGLLIASALFITWVRLRPLRVAVEEDTEVG